MFSLEMRMLRLRSNESPSGAFKQRSGLAQQDGGALPRQAPGSSLTAVCLKPYQKNRITKVTTARVP